MIATWKRVSSVTTRAWTSRMSPTASLCVAPAWSSKFSWAPPSACSSVAPRETMKPCLSAGAWSPGAFGT